MVWRDAEDEILANRGFLHLTLNLTASCTNTVTLQDTTPPSLDTKAGNQTPVECSSSDRKATLTSGTTIASDTCGTVTSGAA